MLIWVQRAQYKTNSRGDAAEALLADPAAADAVREAGQALTANVGLLVTLLDWMLGTAILAYTMARSAPRCMVHTGVQVGHCICDQQG